MASKLTGAIVSVRESGDLITDITAAQLAGVPRDESVTIKCDGHITAGIFTQDHQQPDLTLLAIVGDDDRLVLTLVGESASAFLGITPGSAVVVSW